MCIGGQLCLRKWRFTSSLPILPFPSLNGCMDSLAQSHSSGVHSFRAYWLRIHRAVNVIH